MTEDEAAAVVEFEPSVPPVVVVLTTGLLLELLLLTMCSCCGGCTTTGISWERRIRFELCILTASETDDRSPGNGLSTVSRVMTNEHNLEQRETDKRGNWSKVSAPQRFGNASQDDDGVHHRLRRRLRMCDSDLGIQLGGVRSSQAANSFMGTGLDCCPLPPPPPPPLVPVAPPAPPPPDPLPPPLPSGIFSRFAPLSVILALTLCMH